MTIIEKPWGREEVVELNEHYMVKKLTMWKGHKCSMQYHNKKQETIYVLEGNLRIYIGADSKDVTSRIYTAGESITIAPGVIHRMEGDTDTVYLEASTPQMDDVVRIEDDYNRC